MGRCPSRALSGPRGRNGRRAPRSSVSRCRSPRTSPAFAPEEQSGRASPPDRVDRASAPPRAAHTPQALGKPHPGRDQCGPSIRQVHGHVHREGHVHHVCGPPLPARHTERGSRTSRLGSCTRLHGRRGRGPHQGTMPSQGPLLSGHHSPVRVVSYTNNWRDASPGSRTHTEGPGARTRPGPAALCGSQGADSAREPASSDPGRREEKTKTSPNETRF